MTRIVQSALTWLNQTGELALSALLPISCVFCGSETDLAASRLCTSCAKSLASCCPEKVCWRCAMPLPVVTSGGQSIPGGPAIPGHEPILEGGPTTAHERRDGCAHCKKISYRFSRTFALGIYSGVLRDAVILAKQPSRRVVASTLATLTVQAHSEAFGSLQFDAVTPIPSHWRRRVSRRGTPAQVLAETFARDLGLPMRHALRRVRPTKKQGMLTPDQRRKNVDGSFAVNTGYVFSSAAYSPRGKHVLLVDDVLTTGATGTAAATALLQAGASEVTMAVIARATG